MKIAASQGRLVSIVVITFNSSMTVIETLNSLLVQNYEPLELIVCDDASRDNTVQIVKEWEKENSHKFTRMAIIAHAVNQGICKNVAGGYALAEGEWIKPIAGDDILLPGAIASYMEVATGGTCSVIVSKVSTFTSSLRIGDSQENMIPNEANSSIIAGTPEILLQTLHYQNIIPGPAIMVKRSDYEEIGGLDERFYHLDDWPLWINFLKNGKKICWIPKSLVGYRISSETVSASKNSTRVNVNFLQDHVTFYEKYQIGNIDPFFRLDRALEIFRFKLAKGVLRDFPRLYRFTGIIRFISPIYMKKFLVEKFS